MSTFSYSFTNWDYIYSIRKINELDFHFEATLNQRNFKKITNIETNTLVKFISTLGGLFFGTVGFIGTIFNSYTRLKSDISLMKRLYSEVEKHETQDDDDKKGG